MRVTTDILIRKMNNCCSLNDLMVEQDMVTQEEADEAIHALEKAGQAAYRIGVIEENIDKDPEVRL